jgi:hypothetical protein
MDITELLEPIVRDGIRTTHFFNGRVLTAEDLRTEQHANRDQHRQLARALGAGVAYGLEVTAAEPIDGIPVVRIRAGLAFNRDGDAVELSRTVNLRLVTRSTDIPPEAGLFAVCMAPQQPLELTNIGLYLLTVRPASAFSRERAPMTDLGSEGVGASCGSRWAVAGVRFGVAPLPIAPAGTTATPLGDDLVELVKQIEGGIEKRRSGGAAFTAQDALELTQNLSLLRNGAAYLCFGVDQQAGQHARPLPVTHAAGFAEPAYGAIDGMRGREEIAPCEVPLAVFYLGRDGVEWVDMWAARRPVVPAATAGTLPVLPDRRRRAEAIAMLLQFQQQVAALAQDAELTSTQLAQAEAISFFRYLPPLGLVPIQGPGTPRAFVATAFLNRLAVGPPAPLPGAHIQRLAAAALYGPPVRVAASASVELYRVQENVAAGGAAPPYVVLLNRDTQNLRSRGAVPAVFEDAWNAWRTLLRRRQFIPMGTGDAALSARIAVPAGVQAIMGGALQYGTLAAARCLPTADTLDGFATLRVLQLEFANLLETGLSGVPNIDARLLFAERLKHLINNTSAAERGLGPAITDGSVAAAVQAQRRINQLVGTWSGAPMQGNFDVGFESVSPETPLPGEAVTLRFSLRNRSNSVLTVELIPHVSIAAWQPLLQVLPTEDAAEPVDSVPLGLSETRDVFVRITEIPDDAQDVEFAIRLDAQAGTLSSTSGNHSFTVGEAAESPDPAIRSLTLTSTVPTAALVDNVVHVPGGSADGITAVFLMVVDTPDEYVVSIEPVGTLTGWQLAIFDTDPPGGRTETYEIVETDLTGEGGTASRTIRVWLAAASDAQSAGEVMLSAQRPEQTSRRTVTVNVARS